MTPVFKSILSLWIFVSLPLVAQNLVQNPDFESGTNGWWPFGPGNIVSVPEAAHAGLAGVLVTNRIDWGQGIAQTMLGVLQPEETYRVSVWVKLVEGTAPQQMQLQLHKQDDNGRTLQNIAIGTVNATNWTQLKGGCSLHVNGTLTGLTLALQGAAPGVAFYADEFSAEPYDWKAAANTRIDQLRKRDMRLLIVDSLGNPTPGIGIQIKQIRHKFGFGSAINFRYTNPTYADFFRNNFEWAVIEDETKWDVTEPLMGAVNYSTADGITNFCNANNITLRGHCVFYASSSFVPPWLKNLPDDEALTHMSNRVESVVGRYKGIFKHWDVNNEMLYNNYYSDRFGDAINGWMFRYTVAQDPNVKTFVNDYGILEGSRTEDYKKQITDLIASNAPVGGIGLQAHFYSNRPSPAYIEAQFDNLSQLGLPIWISEYDSNEADENTRADTLESLFRTAFSHPAVDGIMMWGFWAGGMWLGSNAAIVNLDWTTNAAGRRFMALKSEWTTVTNGITDQNGAIALRGFHGDYDIILTPSDSPPTFHRISLDPGSGTNVVTLAVNFRNSQPWLHHPAMLGNSGLFQFQITGDVDYTNAIEASTDGISWSTITNLANPSGTTTFTNFSPTLTPHQYFRARRIP